ncbi:MAG: FG-GAP-like repeat-containing protein, partial [Cyclobacteriaceae bacterium]
MTKIFSRRYGLCLVMIWLFTLTAKGQNFTKVTTSSFDPLTNATAQWVDFNNDGLLDLFVTGTDNLGGFENTVLLNNGNDTFNEISLDVLTSVGYRFGDYNNDGFIDIAIMGRNGSGTKLTKIYQNNNGSTFTSINFGLANLSDGDLVWRDLDNDGDLDIIMTGLNTSDEPTTIAYGYNGTIYEEISIPLPMLYGGKIRASDINNDDIIELILTGYTVSNDPETIIYSIDNNFNISLFTDGLDNTTINDLAIGDYNEDGFSDLIQTGSFGTLLTANAELYQNNGVNGYTKVSSFLQDVFSSSVNFGDMNNDGLSDIILTGIDGGGVQYFNYYINSSPAYNFSLNATGAERIFSGDVAIADYDNDGDLDFFQIGNSNVTPQSNLFESDQQLTVANIAPTIPANLSASVDGDSVRLNWDKATDDLTGQNSLTYNIYISQENNATDIVISPLSSIASGKLYTTNQGNTGHKNFKSINDLPEGRYYWSVQAIDNGFAASEFATESTFSICDPFSIGPDTAICAMESIQLSAGQAGDIVRWVSVTDGELEPNSLTFDYQVLKTDTIVAELTRPFGCTVTDSIIIKANPLPDFSLGNDTA